VTVIIQIIQNIFTIIKRKILENVLQKLLAHDTAPHRKFRNCNIYSSHAVCTTNREYAFRPIQSKKFEYKQLSTKNNIKVTNAVK
jgi:hypothetical protein